MQAFHFILGGIAILLIMLTFFLAVLFPATPPEEALADIPLENNLDSAALESAVEIIMFEDYMCPYTRLMQPVLKQLKLVYGSRISFATRFFPLVEKRPFSFRVAEAAACAAQQNKLWQYRELLFQQEAAALDEQLLQNLARPAGLDTEVFASCMRNRGGAAQVQADLREGLAHGVQGTPTFFIGEKKLHGMQSLGMLRRTIEQQPRKNREDRGTGTP